MDSINFGIPKSMYLGNNKNHKATPEGIDKTYDVKDLFISMNGYDHDIDYYKFTGMRVCLFSGTWSEMKLTNKQRLINKLRKNKSLANRRVKWNLE